MSTKGRVSTRPVVVAALAPAPLPEDQRPVSREIAADGDLPGLIDDLAERAEVQRMADAQERWRSTKAVLRLAAGLCRSSFLDAPSTEAERGIGIESRQLAMARAYRRQGARVLQLLRRQWSEAREMLGPVGSGFRAKGPVLMESRFHEAMEAGLKRRLRQAHKDAASASGKRRSMERGKEGQAWPAATACDVATPAGWHEIDSSAAPRLRRWWRDAPAGRESG